MTISIKKDITNIIKIFIIIFILDLIYLYFNQQWYKKEIFKSQNSELELKWIGVFARYIAQAIGLYIFVLRNNYSLLYASLFGFIIYGNYLGTNYATIKIFDEKLAIVDLIKGTIIMTLSGYIYYKTNKN
jgi:uncharacterized membrane protein